MGDVSLAFLAQLRWRGWALGLADRFFLMTIVPCGTMSDEPSPPGKKSSQHNDQRRVSEWSRISGLGFEFLAYLAVLGYVGWRIDQHYGWKSRGLFGGLLLGMIAWLYRVIRQTRDLFK